MREILLDFGVLHELLFLLALICQKELHMIDFPRQINDSPK
jgi:hypothetical protein